ALGGPIGEVSRGTNGPHEIFGGNPQAELAAVQPELEAREGRREEAKREAIRGAADAFESQTQTRVPEITPAKPTGDVGSIADRERKTGTANDRPQVKYKPSEKTQTLSEKAKDYGREFNSQEWQEEIRRNEGILRNPNATAEDKQIAGDRL